MNPRPSSSPRDDAQGHAGIEERLRSEAAGARLQPPPELRGRVLAALAAAPAPASLRRVHRARSTSLRAGRWLVPLAAAAAVVLMAAWLRSPGEEPARSDRPGVSHAWTARGQGLVASIGEALDGALEGALGGVLGGELRAVGTDATRAVDRVLTRAARPLVRLTRGR